MVADHGRVRVLHVRVPVELVKAVDHYAIEKSISRPEALARLLRRGVEATIEDLGKKDGQQASC